MDINKLQHFRTVVESQSLRSASELLAISPGALSKSLRVFQEELGVRLLEQQGRGIVVTERGRQLYQKSHRLVEELQFLKRNLHEELERQIRFGTYEVFSTHFFSSFLSNEDLENITCSELVPGEIEKNLIDRQIDYGLTLIPFPHPDLDHLCIGHTYMKTFCLEGGKFEDKKIEELKYAVPVTELASNPTNSMAIDSWPESIARVTNFRFSMLESALQACRKDISVIYAPEIVVRLFNEGARKKSMLAEHSYKKANKKVSIYLVKRKESEESSFTKKLAKFIRLNC